MTQDTKTIDEGNSVNPSALHRALGEAFFQNWSNNNKVQKLGQILGHDLEQTVRAIHLTTKGLQAPPLHEHSSIRYKIGHLMATSAATPTPRWTFTKGLFKIGTTYRARRKAFLESRNFDIGVVGDPLISSELKGQEKQTAYRLRTAFFNQLPHLIQNQSAEPPQAFGRSLHYVSGMPYKLVPSGYGVRTALILNALTEQGIACELIHMAFNQEVSDPKQDISVPLSQQGDMNDFIKANTDALTQHLKGSQAETIMAGSNWLNGICALMAARRLGKPFIYDVRGLWPMTRAAVDTGYEDTKAYDVQMQAEFSVMRAADHVCIISDALKIRAISQGVDANKISVMPNMITSSEPILTAKDSNFWTIGHAGTLTAYERLDVLLEMMAELRDQDVEGRPIKLWIAGDGPDLNRLKSLASTLELDHCVKFFGRIARNEVQSLIATSDIMAYPRDDAPVFQLVPPLKPLEAMSLSTPILASFIQPHVDLIGTDNSRGQIVRSYDPKDWSQALISLVSNTKFLSGTVARDALEWVATERASDTCIAPMLKLFSRKDS